MIANRKLRYLFALQVIDQNFSSDYFELNLRFSDCKTTQSNSLVRSKLELLLNLLECSWILFLIKNFHLFNKKKLSLEMLFKLKLLMFQMHF